MQNPRVHRIRVLSRTGTPFLHRYLKSHRLNCFFQNKDHSPSRVLSQTDGRANLQEIKGQNRLQKEKALSIKLRSYPERNKTPQRKVHVHHHLQIEKRNRDWKDRRNELDYERQICQFQKTLPRAFACQKGQKSQNLGTEKTANWAFSRD